MALRGRLVRVTEMPSHNPAYTIKRSSHCRATKRRSPKNIQHTDIEDLGTVQENGATKLQNH